MWRCLDVLKDEMVEMVAWSVLVVEDERVKRVFENRKKWADQRDKVISMRRAVEIRWGTRKKNWPKSNSSTFDESNAKPKSDPFSVSIAKKGAY